MITGQTYDLGRIVNAAGGGSAPANLTTAYTPGTRIAVAGVGNLTMRVSVVIDGSTSTSVRLMDYSEPAKPRELASVRPGSVAAVEHAVTSSADFDLEANIGGTVTTIAIEKKGTGAGITATDAVIVDAIGSEKF